MGKKKASTSLFSPAIFGEILRNERRERGYSNTRKFSAAILDKTGTYIDFDTLLTYERGEREPDVTKLVAIAVTLADDLWTEWLTSILSSCVPEGVEDVSIDTLERLRRSLRYLTSIISNLLEDDVDIFDEHTCKVFSGFFGKSHDGKEWAKFIGNEKVQSLVRSYERADKPEWGEYEQLLELLHDEPELARLIARDEAETILLSNLTSEDFRNIYNPETRKKATAIVRDKTRRGGASIKAKDERG